MTRREDWPRDAVGVRRSDGQPPPLPLPVLKGAQSRDRPIEPSGSCGKTPR
ncbi:MAG: hypothetical protein ACK583_13910 [Cyanobacteriota bacterium]